MSDQKIVEIDLDDSSQDSGPYKSQKTTVDSTPQKKSESKKSPIPWLDSAVDKLNSKKPKPVSIKVLTAKDSIN